MKVSNEASMAMTQTAESQAQITPSIAVQMLRDGNARFVEGQPLNRDWSSQVKQTSTGQYPFAAIVSCIDSRIPTEVVFDQGIGDIFNARIAGNFVNADILGSLEFACKLAGSKVIVVMGHTSCGAVKGACDHAELGNLTQMLDKIMPAVNAIETPEGTDRSSKNLEFVNKVAAIAESIDHHPDIFIHSYNKVKIRVMTHSEGKITQKDHQLAGKIENI